MPLVSAAADPSLRSAVASDYACLGPLFEHFHRNPELSDRELEPAIRTGVEATVVALLELMPVGS